METSTVTPRKVPTTGRGVVLDVADVSDAPDPDGDDICAADSVECVYVYGAPVCVTVCCWVCDSGNEARQDVVVAPSPGGLVMTAGEDVLLDDDWMRKKKQTLEIVSRRDAFRCREL